MILFYQSSRKLLLIIAAAASLRLFLSHHTVEECRAPSQEATEEVVVLGKVSRYKAMVPLHLLHDMAGNTPLVSVISIQLKCFIMGSGKERKALHVVYLLKSVTEPNFQIQLSTCRGKCSYSKHLSMSSNDNIHKTH